MSGKTIAFFPEAAFGPALNSVGIAQASEALGNKAVFLCDPGFTGVFAGYGFPEHPVPMSEPMPPEEMAKYWSDFINGHIPNFRKSALRPARHLRERLLGGDRRPPSGRRRTAGHPGRGQAGRGLRRQRHPLPGDQALQPGERQALGAHHLLLGERDRRSRHPAASLRLWRRGQGLLRKVRCPLQGGGEADPRGLQRLPGKPRRGALSPGRVLRGLALPEPAALSRAGEVQAPPSARPQALPVPRGLRAQGGRVPGPGLRGEQRQAAALRLLRLARRRRHRPPEAAHPAHRHAALSRAGQCRRLSRPLLGPARQRHHRQAGSRSPR